MECPHCFHHNRSGAKVCELCHRSFETEAGEEAQPLSTHVLRAKRVAATAGGDLGLRKSGQCHECGHVNDAEAATCRKCRAALIVPRLNIQKKADGGVSVRSRLASHFLICHPMQPIRLEDRTRYTIGRSQNANIMLPTEQVSRMHAAIRLEEGKCILEDLGSSNGTYHNGKRIKKPVVVQEGDDVAIGGFHMAYQIRKGKVTQADDDAPAEVTEASTVELGGERIVGATPQETVALSSRLEEVSLPGAVQMLSMDERTGILTISGSDRTDGGVQLSAGEIVDAWCLGDETQRGADALFVLCLSRQGDFAFESEEEWDGERTVRLPTHVLIRKMSRLLREHTESAGED